MTGVLVAGVLVSCSPGEGEVEPSAPATSTTSSEPTPTGTTLPTPTSTPAPSATEVEEPVPFPATTADDTAEPSADAALLVTGVRTGVHDGFDRVVFDLDGPGTPGWRVTSVDVATDDPSDRVLDIAGDGTLQVTIIGTAMPTRTQGIGPVLTPDAPALREVSYRGWFEGQDLAFVGVDSPGHPFRVFALTDPTRLVIDVRHDT
ncbi:AMIN-like domain-containing (lipo)protein [Cellulomonas xylanilytica]|uniref:AMIN-like domain-containing protein n=1 Tax=Cellulomonas xylanilytica TaxID=233583 RepID=A0A510V7G2_9CELL|nr:hypothetical protein [Cellulomonas xylanilytica]GEK22812.1 hypothetical protein CXY01_33320 [Cellulomonas xylanilytica]